MMPLNFFNTVSAYACYYVSHLVLIPIINAKKYEHGHWMLVTLTRKNY